MAVMEQEQLNSTKKSISIEYFKAKALQREKKFEEAIIAYETILTNPETPITAYIRLGEIYESLSMIDKAIKTYERGIEVSKLMFDKKTEQFLKYSISSLLELKD
jgi:tetratricopeptide (TPR) repeat protein